MIYKLFRGRALRGIVRTHDEIIKEVDNCPTSLVGKTVTALLDFAQRQKMTVFAGMTKDTATVKVFPKE